MRKLFSLVFVALFAVTASAQITWNVKGGVGLATCYGSEVGLKNHFVGKIGAGIEKPFAKNWSVMPSLELAWKGTETEDYYSDGGKLDIFYLQVPVVAAYRINVSNSWNITLKAGPYFAYGLSGDFKIGEEKIDAFSDDGDCNRFDAGLDVGIDFEYHRFVFGAEYELGLTKMTDGGKASGVKNAAGYITLGYKF